MADFSDPFFDSSFDVGTPDATSVLDDLLGVTTGNSNSFGTADNNDIVDVTNLVNTPSVINNGINSDVSVAAPDFSITQPSNLNDTLDNITQSIVTNPDAGDPWLSTFTDLVDSIIGVDGPTQIKNTTASSSATSKAATSSGSSLGNALSNLFKPKPATTTPKPVASTPSSTANPVAHQLAGSSVTPAKGIDLSTISLWLTIVTSLILIFVFLKKGHT